ncbi:hypothetical protein ACH42_02540 [Endozoicomonas sp. (ex Bugula neritina AB1)]|nr:hypothetical protein ACH42_02540 [Endozoicomonas sp. (ex Bugula neritina AB1)]
MTLKKMAREPLIHFLLASFMLFYIYDVVSPQSAEDNLLLTETRVEQIINRFKLVWKREPTEEERTNLLKDYMLDEIYAEKARDIGLDRDDSVIVKRLRQKMEFMLFDSAGATPPTTEELQAYYLERADMYKSADLYSFDYVTISHRSSSEEVEKFITTNNERLKQGQKPTATSGQQHLKNLTTQRAYDSFGPAFTKELEQYQRQTNEWFGPVKSVFGTHYVNVSHFTEGELPDFELVKQAVFIEWSEKKRLEYKHKYEENLLAEYLNQIEQKE